MRPVWTFFFRYEDAVTSYDVEYWQANEDCVVLRHKDSALSAYRVVTPYSVEWADNLIRVKRILDFVRGVLS